MAKTIAAQIADLEGVLNGRESAAGKTLAKRLKAAREDFLAVVDFVVANVKANPNAAFAGSVPYLFLASHLVGGWQMARALIVAEDKLKAGEDTEFFTAKVATARFFGDHILTRTSALREAILEGADSVTALPVDLF